MATSEQLLDWARNQIGTVGGSKYWQQVYGWSGGGLPWCAVFDSAALKAVGVKCNYFPSTMAFDKRDSSVIGNALVDKYNLKPGDMVSFDWDGDNGGDHVGIVEKVISSGVYQTIEGNVSNSVGRRTRYASNIICGIRPQYSNAAAKEEQVYAFSTVKKGSKNNTVKLLQAALNVRNNAGLYIDGIFGPVTDTAVRNFQKKVGIVVDGICGPVTWGKLFVK